MIRLDINEEKPSATKAVGDPTPRGGPMAGAVRSPCCKERKLLRGFDAGNVSTRIACSTGPILPRRCLGALGKKISRPRLGAKPHMSELALTTPTQVM